MKSPGIIAAIAALAVLVVLNGIALAQAGDKAVTVADLLKQAKCPLTDAQAKQLKAIDLSQGREVYQTLNTMFDEKQTEALKKALGTQPGRNDRPDSPRYLRQVVVLEKAGCPMTEKQLASIMALPQDQSSREKVNEILTEKQREEMQKVMPRRQQ